MVEMNEIAIRVLDDAGSGDPKTVWVPQGTTLRDFYRQVKGASTPRDNFLVLVNRCAPPQGDETVLRNSDTVSFTPQKVRGAA